MKRLERGAPRRARWIAVSLAGAGILAMLAAPGCGDDESRFPAPTGGPPNVTTSPTGTTMTGGAGGGVAVDLCACAAGLSSSSCSACNQAKINSGQPCDGKEATCSKSLACKADANCVGACLTGTLPDMACIKACLDAATSAYLAYLGCICTECTDACTSEATCP